VVTKVKVLKAPVFTEDELQHLHQGRTVAQPTEAARPAEDTPADEAAAAAEPA
jgi:hypothetical protein